MIRTFLVALLALNLSLAGCSKDKEADKKDEKQSEKKQDTENKQAKSDAEKPKANTTSGDGPKILAVGVARPQQMLKSEFVTALGLDQMLEPLMVNGPDLPLDPKTVAEVTAFVVSTGDLTNFFTFGMESSKDFDEPKREDWEKKEEIPFDEGKGDFDFPEDEKFPCAPHPGEEHDDHDHKEHAHDEHGHDHGVHEHEMGPQGPPISGGAVIRFIKPVTEEEFQKMIAPAGADSEEWDSVEQKISKEEYNGKTIVTVVTTMKASDGFSTDGFDKEPEEFKEFDGPNEFKEEPEEIDGPTELKKEDDCDEKDVDGPGSKDFEEHADDHKHGDEEWEEGFSDFMVTRKVEYVKLDDSSYLVGEGVGIKYGLDNLAKDGQVSDLLDLLPDGIEIGFVATMEDHDDLRKSLKDMTNFAMEQAPAMLKPLATLPDQVVSVSGYLHMDSASGEPMLEVTIEAVSKGSADGLTATATGFLALGKGLGGGFLTGDDVPPPQKAIAKRLNDLLQSMTVSQDEMLVNITLPNPGNMKELANELKPAVQDAIKQAEEAAKRMEKVNNLKQILLGLHNYHETYNGLFLDKNSGVPEFFDENGNYKISWRAHIAPFIEFPGEINLKESWQSEGNKKFLSQMPPTLGTMGVGEPNKTGWRVFSGPSAPIQPGKSTRFRDFLDGTSKTILVVQVGPDKAVDWTDPTPLKFDPKDPAANKAALGNLPGDNFLVGFADGSVKTFPTSISPELLTKFLTINGGEEITEEELEKNGLDPDEFYIFGDKEDSKFEEPEDFRKDEPTEFKKEEPEDFKKEEPEAIPEEIEKP